MVGESRQSKKCRFLPNSTTYQLQDYKEVSAMRLSYLTCKVGKYYFSDWMCSLGEEGEGVFLEPSRKSW